MIKHLAKVLAISAAVLATSNALASTSQMGPARSVTATNAYYDDFYGPFYNGYWTTAGDYFFSVGPGRPYVRDDGHHFSQVMNTGFRSVEGVVRERTSDFTASR